ncbi:hypothetical protein COU19_02905 [Candidatus Kaiserbacteria bacterium CG10_big_fil_rev_8_21_14_0_10_56_12]|uniref:Uncharacterized protein n=1 Tax=Candidatus Kaiserbacteria bacterium CG10_big_fil_rev_8_21_14_0_10_56_12 TaxID=1974611 RepID=A0A2H0U994_9BACT|nr:MAG: hypothetical protein COU19_02905 [Candidatus Kaiserbacteria bacterium CG10_big_fil_rev_8_21_14_0_10_56_12]
MIYSIKKLSPQDKEICEKTLGPRPFFALVGDHIARRESLSVVRVADGERALLEAPDGEPFTLFNRPEENWNKRYGIAELSIEEVKKNILQAGNTCTYFAPSISGISRDDYRLYDFFNSRDLYVDNFFVNDWTREMIGLLLHASDGVFVIHKDADELIENFAKTYGLDPAHFAGFTKLSARDNDAAVAAAIESKKHLVLFSAGPAGKIIGPQIAKDGRVTLDIGNTLHRWSLGNVR